MSEIRASLLNQYTRQPIPLASLTYYFKRNTLRNSFHWAVLIGLKIYLLSVISPFRNISILRPWRDKDAKLSAFWKKKKKRTLRRIWIFSTVRCKTKCRLKLKLSLPKEGIFLPFCGNSGSCSITWTQSYVMRINHKTSGLWSEILEVLESA